MTHILDITRRLALAAVAAAALAFGCVSDATDSAPADPGATSDLGVAPRCAPPNVACVFCPNGYLTGPGGCRTCSCKPAVPPPLDASVAASDASADGPRCAPPNVACIFCPNGYLTGPGGCRTCSCK